MDSMRPGLPLRPVRYYEALLMDTIGITPADLGKLLARADHIRDLVPDDVANELRAIVACPVDRRDTVRAFEKHWLDLQDK